MKAVVDVIERCAYSVIMFPEFNKTEIGFMDFGPDFQGQTTLKKVARRASTPSKNVSEIVWGLRENSSGLS